MKWVCEVDIPLQQNLAQQVANIIRISFGTEPRWDGLYPRSLLTASSDFRRVTPRCLCKSFRRSILANDPNALRWSDVVSRLLIDLVGGVEILLDELLASGQAVTTTHDGTPAARPSQVKPCQPRTTYNYPLG